MARPAANNAAIEQETHMNNLRIAFRHIMKEKSFSTINIAGFAFAMAVCLMIALFIQKEYSYNRYHSNAGRIFRLTDSGENTSAIDYRVKERLLMNHPEIRNACLVMALPGPVEINHRGTGTYLDGIMSVDNAFFEMFSVPFAAGDASRPLANLNSAVLTESAARRLFAGKNPLGQEILISHQVPVTVTGVIRDFPDNSSIAASVIVNAAHDDFKFSFSCEDSRDKNTYRYFFNIYLLLGPEADPVQLADKISRRAELLAPYAGKVSLLALTGMYLHDSTTGGYTVKGGNPRLLMLLTAIASIVFTLAVINYINLALARQNRRNKETGVRKVVGAGRKELLGLFLTESLLVVLFSFAAALCIVSAVLPWFGKIVDRSLDLHSLFSVSTLPLLLLAVLLIGLLAGAVPALRLSACPPGAALTRQPARPGRPNRFRQLLTVFQFSVSIALIICLVVILKQIDFVKHRDAGFAKEQLLRVDLPNIQEKDMAKTRLLMDRWRQSPYFLNLSVTSGAPGQINWHMGSGVPGKSQHLSIIYADEAFLDTFRLPLVRGRTLRPGEYGTVCLINETAYRYFGWDNLENKRYNNGRQGGFEVIGVVRDFHFASLHQAIEPLAVLYQEQAGHINLRIAPGQTGPAMTEIGRAWREVLPDYPLQYQFYDEWYDAQYRKEERFAGAIGLFALLAISISCLGILGLAIYAAETRVKEFGIRKAIGASRGDILALINRDFVKWVLVAQILAGPAAWWAMQQWLQDFAYRTPVGWWIFALAGASALAIALLTVSWQAWRAASRNPVESLKYE